MGYSNYGVLHNNPYGFEQTDAEQAYEQALAGISTSPNARYISDVLTEAANSVEEEAPPVPFDRLGHAIGPGDVIVYGSGNLGIVVKWKSSKERSGLIKYELLVAKAPPNLRRPNSYYESPIRVWVKDLNRVFVQTVKPKDIGLVVTPIVEVKYA